MQKKYRYYGLGLFAVIICFIYYILHEAGRSASDPSVPLLPTDRVTETPEKKKAEPPIDKQKQPLEAVIDIKGAVKHPGVYTLSTSDRVLDAIKAAGGLTADADEARVNLAAHLADAMVITVPLKSAAGDSPAPQSAGTLPATAESPGGVVHLNSADLETLESLPGIGPGKAEAILEYRAQKGGFQSIEEIMDVDGIGEKTFERMKDQLAL